LSRGRIRVRGVAEEFANVNLFHRSRQGQVHDLIKGDDVVAVVFHRTEQAAADDKVFRLGADDGVDAHLRAVGKYQGQVFVSARHHFQKRLPSGALHVQSTPMTLIESSLPHESRSGTVPVHSKPQANAV